VFAPDWRPAADVYETQATVDVTLELPGVDVDDVEVALLGNALVVRGRRRLPHLEPRGVYHTMEIGRGTFRAQVTLPSRVEAEPRELHYELGLLLVRFAKRESTNGGD
jgi:HSP20 family protein